MPPAPQVVSHHLVVELIGSAGPVPVDGELRYDAADPYAVTVSFSVPRGEVVWQFGRDLLMRGVHRPAGEGDVQVSPSLNADGHAVVALELSSPNGRALVLAPARDVLDFLAHTTLAVWPGTESEHLRVDDTIAALLVGD